MFVESWEEIIEWVAKKLICVASSIWVIPQISGFYWRGFFFGIPPNCTDTLEILHLKLQNFNFTYRVFELGLYENKCLLGHQKCTFKSWKWYLYIYEMRTFDLWHLDLVENNIPVLHSLSPEWWENFTWNSIILFRNIFFQNIKIRGF